jgi:hypothetical protein
MIVVEVHIKDDEFKSGSKTISITTGYGSEYIDNPSAYTPFGEDDYWRFGHGEINMGGYCDGPNEGQETDSDAGEQIEYKINNPNYEFDDPYPAGSYLTDIVYVTSSYWEGQGDYTYEIHDYPNPNDDVPGDGYLDYLAFYVDWYLSPEEMNFYLQGYLDIIESERQKLIIETGLNYEFVYVDLMGIYWYGPTAIASNTSYGIRRMAVPPTD